MNIGLYADNTIGLNPAVLCDRLNATCSGLRFTPGTQRLRVEAKEICWPDTYRQLRRAYLDEAESFDLALVATNVPYEEEYFWMFGGKVGFVSLAGWNLVTDLPVTNGFVYFIASIVSMKAGLTTVHQE